jgi:integrase
MKDWTVKQVLAAPPGRHGVSKSLILIVKPDRTRRWAFRFTKPSTGKVTEHGLGSIEVMSLAEAREKVLECRRMVSRGIDPIDHGREQRRPSVTFADVAAEFIDVKSRRYRSPGSTRSIRLLLIEHASALGDRAIGDIGSAHIVTALRPLWLQSPFQTRRVLAALSQVFNFAKAQGLCETNPAEWKENMAHLFPMPNGPKNHFKALEFAKIPALVRALRAAQASAMSSSVLEFIVLTASRENEACAMLWSEVDLEARLWTLPPNRSKTAKVHRVPLSDRAVELLTRQREQTPGIYVWPSRDGKGHINGKSVYRYLTEAMGCSVTVHGFRSSFRDWAGDTTDFARDHVEECLAHSVGSAVERAYRRGDALAKRREIMEAWASYCQGISTQD